MSNPSKTLEFTVERIIPAPPEEVFDAWLDPNVPGNPWNTANKLLLNPVVDGFFYWLYKTTAHYGLFTEVARPARLAHTWVSPNTLGMESTIVVTFEKVGEGTKMTLVHSGLPDTDSGRGHEKGWNFFVGGFAEQLAGAKQKQG